MKFPLEPRKLSAAEEAEWAKDHFEIALEGLVERFHLTGDQKLLEQFILDGGDIHKYGLAEVIVDLMNPKTGNNPGGAEDAKMRSFYLDVEMARKSPALKDKNKFLPSDASLQEQVLRLKKKTSLSDAIAKVAERSEIGFDGGKYRYKRGKEFFAKDS